MTITPAVYTASDGTQFSDEAKCLAHESDMSIIQKATATNPEIAKLVNGKYWLPMIVEAIAANFTLTPIAQAAQQSSSISSAAA